MYIKSDDQYALKFAKKMRFIKLLGGRCSACGNADPVVLQFHHPNDDKESDLKALKTRRLSVVEKEILKCQLLCGNCHGEKRLNSSRLAGIKQKLLEMKGSFQCEKCAYNKNIGSLHFHHVGEKKFHLSDVFRLNPSVETILAEMDKCVVWCVNCHIRWHTKVDRIEKLMPLILSKMASHKEYAGPIDHRFVEKLLKGGMKQTAIAEQLGCARSTICIIAKNLKPGEQVG